ncbi:hypothetical protein [Pseudalkalibacillus caeni]|uniref:Uncharacterized protein n=1 Tax=Exobacillus caeni TaxID=2574798 RepID=A0A5R9F9F0_9BACL|nr:hypothetical protein [Pseudalkalibacillus caeni]TLS36335.1 hypothetical protein FCL54_15495 [Pseudalkalibacillus caeni]
MKLRYGVEMKQPVDKLPGFIAQIIKATGELVNVTDRDGTLAIVQTSEEANKLALFYEKKGMLESTFSLFQLNPNSTLYGSFSDYGFISRSDVPYLFVETTIPFTITDGDETQIRMAKMQMEEDFLAIEPSVSNIYYVDHHKKELLEGYARAYGIKVTFLCE